MPYSIKNRIKNSQLKNSIENIIFNAKNIHKNPFLHSFTDHGIEHSNRMLGYVNKLLINCQQKELLNEYESYVLVAAIYLHDIGIEESKLEVLKKFSKTYGIPLDNTSDIKAYVRKNHALISSFLINEDINAETTPLAYDGDPELGKYISLVVESHGIDFSNCIDKYKSYIYHDDLVRVNLLSVLLCLADSFDCDKRRIDPKRFRYTELPEISRIHWMKHLYVRGLNFDNRIITISYSFPQSNIENQEIYKMFFCGETEYWLHDIKKRYMHVLNEFNLFFDIRQEINYNGYVQELSEMDYNYIEENAISLIEYQEHAIYKKVSIGILIHQNNILMVQRRKPEKSLDSRFANDVLEWQFPAGTVKALENPDEAIVREIEEETGIKCCIDQFVGKRFHPNTFTLCYYYSLNYSSGELVNGDTTENKMVSWIPFCNYQNKITSNLYWKVKKFLDDKENSVCAQK